jgi:hypothetical protein
VRGAHGRVIHNPNPTFTDRPHRIFGVVGRAKFAGDDNIQRRVQVTGDLGGDHHTAAGNTERHGHGRAEPVEQLGELLPGINAVAKHPGSLPRTIFARRGRTAILPGAAAQARCPRRS